MDEEIAAATATADEGKAALESVQQELAAANDKVTALEAQLEEAKNVSFFQSHQIFE
jgi:predicted  nucleic acid-binding Zn-ribbon protein